MPRRLAALALLLLPIAAIAGPVDTQADALFARLAGELGSARALPDLFRVRSEEHTSELQSLTNLVCRLLLEQNTNLHWGRLRHLRHPAAARTFRGTTGHGRSPLAAAVPPVNRHRRQSLVPSPESTPPAHARA